MANWTCVCGNEFSSDDKKSKCPRCGSVRYEQSREDKLIMDFEEKLLQRNWEFQEKNFRKILKEELGIHSFVKENVDNMDFQLAGININGSRIYLIPVMAISLLLSIIFLFHVMAHIPLATILMVIFLSFGLTLIVCMLFYIIFFKNPKNKNNGSLQSK